MKSITEEFLDELIDIAVDQLGTKSKLAGTSKRNDAIISDLERTIRDAKNILYGGVNT